MDVTFRNEFISIEDHFLSGSINYFSYENPVSWPSKDVGKLYYKATEISIDIFNVTSIKIIGKRLFIPITCGLRQNNNEFSMNVTGLIWSEFISQTSMTDLFIQSELTLKQTQSIKLHGMDPIEKKYYMRPVMNMNTVRYNSMISNMNNAMYDMLDRNLTLHLGKTHYYMSTSETGAQPSESFHITLVINLPEQELLPAERIPCNNCSRANSNSSDKCSVSGAFNKAGISVDRSQRGLLSPNPNNKAIKQ
ncbi:unnamed protein product [Schistosoma margrebowiei]|uniref:Uncharacterized protein n=1 Tax=Schistosoma margrebowiei TaxID=48269 RepID=A0A183N040_9TREM|nr:unnamed protein product [Schistosoma margrebowiei]